MDKKERVLVVRQLSKENEWIGDVVKRIDDEFTKHNRGYLLVPFSHIEEIVSGKPKKTVLLTDLEPECFMAAITSAIQNYTDTYFKIFTDGKSMSANRMAKLIQRNVKATGGAK